MGKREIQRENKQNKIMYHIPCNFVLFTV